MSSGYVDTQVIECSRLHSEEAKSNNNENYSLWTNNLTDILHLDAGDQVSVFGAMISERGAGQGDVIEIKGESLGFKKTFDFIEINSSGNACDNIPVKYDILQANVSTKEVEMRDDTAVFKIGYYITADGHNYVQLPRRFWWRNGAKTANFGDRDIGPGSVSANDSGRSLWDPFNSSQGTVTTHLDNYQLFDDYYQNADQNYGYSSQLNNGRRYTIMIRDTTYFSGEWDDFPDVYFRDPENAIYRRYTELKEIQVDKGFNSPDHIATDVTRKLQAVISTNTFGYRVAGDLSANPKRPGFPINQFKTYTTETYKPFNVAWNYVENTKADFDLYIAGNNTTDGWQYLSQYHITACLRPELYETGRLINWSGTTYRGFLGTYINASVDNNDAEPIQYFHTDIRYEEPYITYFKDFIRAQEKYPEVFNIFSDSRTPYNNGDNINNCRWWHVNRYKNGSMSLNPADDIGDEAQLGWGGYIQPSWRTTQQLSAILVPYVYDPDQKDNFYDNPDDGLNQLSYGCFARHKIGDNYYIKLKISPNNGYGSNLFTELGKGNASGEIEQYRIAGYDIHFNSVGTPWILPHSGHTIQPNSTNGNAYTLQSARQYANQGVMDALTPGPWYVDYPHLSQLYIGADAPRLNWDGSHFTLSDLHTGINRGNDRRAGAPFDIGVGDIDIDQNAGDIVYKINPRENYEDWTPVRMPYVSEKITYINGSHIDQNAYIVEAFNENLTQWQIYDASCGIFIEDFGLSEQEWTGSFWERLGFSYRQFHNPSNTRLDRVEKGNANNLSIITTNSEVDEGDTKILSQNMYKAIFYNNMIPRGGTLNTIVEGTEAGHETVLYLPEIIQKTQSISLIADNLPTRMIRGYYTIRSNIIEQNPFVGGKKDNTIMPICGIVNKINGAGDFYQQEGSEVSFTITKPMRLASIKCSIHDPDGSYANSNEQNTVLFKVVKQKNFTFNVVQELIQQNGGKMPAL